MELQKKLLEFDKRTFLIPYKAVSSKNKKALYLKKNGKYFIGNNPKVREFFKKTTELLLWQQSYKNYTPPTPVYVHIVFGFKTNHVRDLSNFNQAILDCLTNAKIIKDDNYKYVIPVNYYPFTGIDFAFINFEYLNINELYKFINLLKNSS